MSLVEILHPLPDYRRTPLSLLRWWESRRLLFNVVVGTTGLWTLGGVFLVSSLPPRFEHLELLPLLAVSAVYGVLANVCFSVGWLVEMLARQVWGREAPDLGPLLFRHGLVFSVGLTLFPLLLSVLFWVLRVVLAFTT